MKTLIIIPAYNEGKTILGLIEKLHEDAPDVDYVIINDCSTDNTQELCEKHNLNFINLPFNLGIGGGVQTGYLYAKQNDYDIVVQIDGDGQHDTSYLNKVLEPIINDDYDIVIGSRFISKEGFQSTGTRRIGITFLSKLIKLCSGITIKDATSGFRAVNKKYIDFYSKEYAQDYPEPEAILTAALNGARIKEVSVKMNERIQGTSSINFYKSLYYMIKVSLAILINRITYIRREKNEQ